MIAKTALGAGCAVFMSYLAATTVEAATFDVVGLSSPNTTATVDFNYDGINALTISITNTATVSSDPRITGFAFNAPDAVTGVSGFTANGTAGDAGWFGFFDPNGVNSPQIGGDFDAGGSNNNGGNSDITGGFPNGGIVFGSTGIFTLLLSGNAMDLAALTASSFLNLAVPGGTETFAVRFQRLDDGIVTSDVAVPVPSPVPVPAAGLLILTGIAGLGLLSRRRKAA